MNGLLSPFIELGVGFDLDLNARNNIRINATLAGLTRRQLDSRFDEILEFSELERFVDQKLKNYSSGMLMRLAYSIAIQIPFDVLLLDEVLAVGDEAFNASASQPSNASNGRDKQWCWSRIRSSFCESSVTGCCCLNAVSLARSVHRTTFSM